MMNPRNPYLFDDSSVGMDGVDDPVWGSPRNNRPPPSGYYGGSSEPSSQDPLNPAAIERFNNPYLAHPGPYMASEFSHLFTPPSTTAPIPFTFF